MHELTALLGIAAAISIGAASPGPSFIMVARTAVSASRIDALFAALGMGVGGLAFACLSLVGLNGLLIAVPSLYLYSRLRAASISPIWEFRSGAVHAGPCRRVISSSVISPDRALVRSFLR